MITLLPFVFALLISFAADAQYEQAMVSTLTQLDSVQTAEQYQAVANRFTRIARAEKQEWLPWYYASYAQLAAASQSEGVEATDAGLAQSQVYLDSARLLEQGNAELVAMQGYIYMLQVAVDPGSRGQELSPQAIQTLSRAVAMDKSNPRALTLLGRMQYGTAQFFGSDTSESCRLFEAAVAAYEKEAQQERGILPTWGSGMARYMVQQCSGVAEK